MGYLTGIFYGNNRLVELLNSGSDSDTVVYIGLSTSDNVNMTITVHKYICLRGYLEIYNYNISTKEFTYTNRFLIHPQHSFDAYRTNYLEIIEG